MSELMGSILGPNVPWSSCAPDRLEELRSILLEWAPGVFANLRVVEGEHATLPFGRKNELFALEIEGVPGLDRAFIIETGSSYIWLDGTSSPVHQMNDLDALQLGEDQVLDYLRWFFFTVRGGTDAFVLLDDPASVTDEGAGPERLAEVRSAVVPFAFAEGTSDAGLLVACSIAYAGVAFNTQVSVSTSGLVEMLDDQPITDLDGFGVPSYPPLAPLPESPSAPANDSSARFTPRAELHTGDVDVTSAVVSVLLSAAVREQLGHTLLQRFNTRSGSDGWSALLRFVQESTSIIIIESEIPFAEDIVAGLIDPTGATFPSGTVRRADAMSGDDARCCVMLDSSTRLQLISFHAYQSLWDTERTAYQLSIGPASVLIGCDRFADVPDALRRVTDLVLTLPRIDPALFVKIFEGVFHVPPPTGWDVGPDGADWTRYLLHTDFHAPQGLKLTPGEALDHLRERCSERLRQLSADDAPALNDLHGLGEARQIAEDLIADIAEARSGAIPWSSVDRGFLLVGAPGTGKTTLAKAIARECGVKFVQGSAAAWQSAGALDAHLKAMRATFSEARRYAPTILFIDEIDSIGNRELLSGQNATYQTDVINALLEQVQGMDPDEPVIVIGATNFVERVDPALRRAGRLDQIVTVSRPNVAGLTEIFKHYLRPYRAEKTLAADVDETLLAQLAFGATGADVELFVRGAARRARKEQRVLAQVDLVSEVTRRPRREDNVVRLAPDELRRVAVHEAGHAMLKLASSGGGADLAFISIIPRMDGSLGFVASAPNDSASITRRECIEHIEVALGGRAAEELVYGQEEVSTGAGGSSESSDLAIATRVATSLVCSSGLGGDGSLLWTGEPTPAQMTQIDGLLRDAYVNARRQLELHRSTFDAIADTLVRDQEIDGDTLRAFVSSLGPTGE